MTLGFLTLCPGQSTWPTFSYTCPFLGVSIVRGIMYGLAGWGGEGEEAVRIKNCPEVPEQAGRREEGAVVGGRVLSPKSMPNP